MPDLIPDTLLAAAVKDAAEIERVTALIRVIEEERTLSTFAIGPDLCWRVMNELKEKRLSMFWDLAFKLRAGTSGHVENDPLEVFLEWTGIENTQIFNDCEWIPAFFIDENGKDMMIPTIKGYDLRVCPGDLLVRSHSGQTLYFSNPDYVLVVEPAEDDLWGAGG